MVSRKVRNTVAGVIRRHAPSLYGALRETRDRNAYKKWVQSGRGTPLPYLIKPMAVKEYAEKHGPTVFLESGTYLGHMVYSVRDTFTRIYSIELDPVLHSWARKRFANYGHISILQGDSGAVLSGILDQIDEPCIFWLDGHYSGGVTARGVKDTPIAEELNHIFNHRIDDHVILIDDARKFNGEDDYPTLDSLRDYVAEKSPDYSFEVRHDIIRISKGT